MQETVYHYFGNWREQLISTHPRNRVMRMRAPFSKTIFYFPPWRCVRQVLGRCQSEIAHSLAHTGGSSVEHYDFSGARISKHVRDQNMGIFNPLFFLLAVQPDQAASCPGRTDRWRRLDRVTSRSIFGWPRDIVFQTFLHGE